MKKTLDKYSETHKVVKLKFSVGDIISNGKVEYRVDGITKNCFGQDSYFLVNIEDEEKGLRKLIVTDSEGKHHYFGETEWLCEQVDRQFKKKELKNEQKSTWSEEDEIKIKSIIAFLKSPSLCAMDGNKGIIDENVKYLKSLRQRYIWKPTKEQMYLLSWIANIKLGGDSMVEQEVSKHLNELYEDLKKL